jgi:hypothetical protein
MGYVNSLHEERTLSDHGFFVLSACPMDSYVLAQRNAVLQDGPGFFSLEIEVLGKPAHNGVLEQSAVFADADTVTGVYEGFQFRPFPDYDIVFDYAVRPYRYIFRDLRFF